MKKRILSLMLSAMMLLTPMASVAEASYTAGELTTTVVSESYAAGKQINLTAVLGMNLDEQMAESALQPLASLLGRSQVQMSFYDDFGTACVHLELIADDFTLLSADVLTAADGSMQIMTNLTGKYVLALPAAQQQAISLADYDFNDPEQVAAFRSLPAYQRLLLTGNDMISLLINHLLGWVSYTQMDMDGQLYVFDDTYLEATETRDPVAQRMLGTLTGEYFTTLLWNIATTVADTTGEFQQALADLLAQCGVTRYQARTFIDSLLTEETIDPALDWVQPSYWIIENKDASPICYDDVSYFFKKLQKSADRIWDNSTENIMRMDVSYDDFGGMVGFDAHAPQFTTLLPYEGDFTYSIKTDDNWQRFHTAHGELQVYNDNRVVGDLDIQFGEDIDGRKESSFKGNLDVLNRKDNTSLGFGVDAMLNFDVAAQEDGQETEAFDAAIVIDSRENAEGTTAMGMTLSGMTATNGERFETNATAMLAMESLGELVADVKIEQAEYEEGSFVGGQAINLREMDKATADMLKAEIVSQATGMGMKLITKPGLMSDLLALFGRLK